MSTYHIFYDSNKNIKWATDAPTDSTIISSQADIGLSHLELDLEQIPACDHFYINDAEDNVVDYNSFSLNFSATTIAIEETITITGCPTGTEIFLDNVSAGTYTSGSLTLTGSMAGSFIIKFVKDKYYETTQQIIVSRYTT
tara:strand:+ start:1682 stop:2104 length:423 start_codon:yes stop_codon:yes gene_type:complete